METAELKQQLKKQIVEFLNLLSVNPIDIKDDEPLFGEGLGLDSIDSIELIVLLNREYGVVIEDPKEGRKILLGRIDIVDKYGKYWDSYQIEIHNTHAYPFSFPKLFEINRKAFFVSSSASFGSL